jgi:NADH-quinone oxidoreductase subunit F
MDLHIIGGEPTDEERGAVDALLGPPESGWDGGLRDAARDTRAAYGGLDEVRARRDLLLPALHAAQDRVGWVSRGALNYICKRLIVPPAEAWGDVLSLVQHRARAASRRPRLRRYRLSSS